MPGKRFFYSSRYYEWALKLNYSANRLFFNALVYAFSFFLWKLKLARPFGVGEPATKLRYQYSCVCCSFFCEKLQDFFCWRTGNSMPWYHFYVHSWYCANVVVVVSFWIFTAMPVSVCPILERFSRAPPPPPQPDDRARRLLHTAALEIAGERTGPNARLGERGV